MYIAIYIFKIFRTPNATAFLAAELMADPSGCFGLCVPSSVAILSAAFVGGDYFVHSLAGTW